MGFNSGFKGLKKICPASFRDTCQWLKFSLNGLQAQSRVTLLVGLLPLTSGPACLRMAFPAFLVKQLHRCDLVVISSFVRTGYTARRWGWLLGRIGYSITHHYPLYPRKVYDVELNYFQAAPNQRGWDGLCMKRVWGKDKNIKAFVEKTWKKESSLK